MKLRFAAAALALFAVPAAAGAQDLKIQLKLDQTVIENFDGDVVPEAIAPFDAGVIAKTTNDGLPAFDFHFPGDLSARATPMRCKDDAAHTGCTGLRLTAYFDLPEGAAEGVLRGCYVFESYQPREHQHGGAIPPKKVTLMGSGAILTEVVKAAEQLASEGVEVTVLSVTSWSELARDGVACEQRALAGDAQPGAPWLTQQLARTQGPVIAATDYVRAVPETVRAFVPEGRRFTTLGTDGFGRSDTRAALRQFFGVDAASVARVARHAVAAA